MIPAQDFSNLPRQQKGLHAKGFEYMRLSNQIEGLISNLSASSTAFWPACRTTSWCPPSSAPIPPSTCPSPTSGCRRRFAHDELGQVRRPGSREWRWRNGRCPGRARLGDRAAGRREAGLVGGATGMSGGMVWLPNNPLMRAEGVADSTRTAWPTSTTSSATSVRRRRPHAVRCSSPPATR